MTSWQRLERAREARLWIKDIIVPAVLLVGTYVTLNPGKVAKAKETVNKKVSDIKDHFKKED